ncbi:MAG: 2-C-methyl-D-erythritol 2,4-cyclodiphosphate synthase [Cytophagaceae bacterium]|nr:2-C-methyl-D-erythritol 2,4-cyclodiphosphate synthase [Cytophagaceae bacterium]
MFMYRTGTGYDVHQLADGYELWIGGVKIPYEKGSKGHSDGDVLIHALCDALLGAANFRDIGYHFPDTDAQYKGIDSKILLKHVDTMVRQKGYAIVNIDSTVVLQQPKISGFIPLMKTALAAVLNLNEDCVSVKATTTERMGFEGRGEGISAQVAVMLRKC